MTITRQPDLDETTTERFLQYLEHKDWMQTGDSPHSKSWNYETYCERRMQVSNPEPSHYNYSFLSRPDQPFEIITENLATQW